LTFLSLLLRYMAKLESCKSSSASRSIRISILSEISTTTEEGYLARARRSAGMRGYPSGLYRASSLTRLIGLSILELHMPGRAGMSSGTTARRGRCLCSLDCSIRPEGCERELDRRVSRFAPFEVYDCLSSRNARRPLRPYPFPL